MNCPECNSEQTTFFDRDVLRQYYQCENCTLIFVPRNELIDHVQEQKRYEAHENDATDVGYRQYLQKIVDQILPNVTENARGLDYGCGRTQLLSELFQTQGRVVHSYDLYFLKDESIWDQQYDFIVLSEVIEHLRNPSEEMSRVLSLLSSSASLFIKTKVYPDRLDDFQKWFYKRDQTHVQFYSITALTNLAERHGLSSPEYLGNDLYLFKK